MKKVIKYSLLTIGLLVLVLSSLLLYGLTRMDTEYIVIFASESRPFVSDISQLYLKHVRKDFSDSPEIVFFTLASIQGLNSYEPVERLDEKQKELMSLIDHFIENGIDINAKLPDSGYSKALAGATVLHTLAQNRDILLIKEMIKRGADLSIENQLSQTPLAFILEWEKKVPEKDFSEVITVLSKI